MENEQQILTIDELVELTGISGNMVSFYVRSKLLDPPEGSARGTYYTRQHIQRLSKIQAWQAEGMSHAGMLQRVRGFRNPWYCQSTG